MKYEFHIMKGIPPGPLINRMLSDHRFEKAEFASRIGMDVETFQELLDCKVELNPATARILDREFGYCTGYFMKLQSYYSHEKERKRKQRKPDLDMLRGSLFWDTRIETIDWDKYRRSVVERVFQRGDKEEREEITRFYGQKVIDRILKDAPHNSSPPRHPSVRLQLL